MQWYQRDSVFVSVPILSDETFSNWNFQIGLIFKDCNLDEFVNKSAFEKCYKGMKKRKISKHNR